MKYASPHTLTVSDFDNLIIETTVNIQPIYAKHMFQQSLQLDSSLTHQKFLDLCKKLKAEHGSTTQGFQHHFSQPDEWSYEVWRLATPDMHEELAKTVVYDPEIPELIRALKEEYGHEFVILSHSPRFFIRPLLEMIGISHLVPERNLVDIIELESRTKLGPEPYDYTDKKFGDFKTKNMLDDLVENLKCAREKLYRGWYKGLIPPPPGTFDFHHQTFKEILHALPMAAKAA